jgi:hypothetical protein
MISHFLEPDSTELPTHNPHLLHSRLCSAANTCAQYAEGMVFRCFLQEGRVLRMTELPLVQTEE